jgi:hypothetical protein
MPRDRIIITFFSLSLVALIIAAGMTIFMLPMGTDHLILHFDPEHSIDFLGGKNMVLSVLGILLVMNGINFILCREVYYRERFLSYLVAFTTLIVSIFCLIAAGVIVTIN